MKQLHQDRELEYHDESELMNLNLTLDLADLFQARNPGDSGLGG
jgi:hypothetical protein